MCLLASTHHYLNTSGALSTQRKKHTGRDKRDEERRKRIQDFCIANVSQGTPSHPLGTSHIKNSFTHTSNNIHYAQFLDTPVLTSTGLPYWGLLFCKDMQVVTKGNHDSSFQLDISKFGKLHQNQKSFLHTQKLSWVFLLHIILFSF